LEVELLARSCFHFVDFTSFFLIVMRTKKVIQQTGGTPNAMVSVLYSFRFI
jgi:hypothetical protein